MLTVTDGDGAYARDERGTWRDARDGSAVRGARDLTLAALFGPVPSTADGTARLVPRGWATRRPDHPLAWAFGVAAPAAPNVLEVPAIEWDARADVPVAMAAPELHPWNLVGIEGAAAVCGVGPATIRSYLARGQMPPPIARLGGSPVWPRPLLERWHAGRRGARSQ